MTQRFPSHVALSDETKAQLGKTLNTALATAIDLQLQVKQAHWNIKGPQFFARHQLFDELSSHLTRASDQLAERAATLGGYAEGTVRLSASNSILPEYDLKATDGRTHIRTLVDRFEKHCKFLRDATVQAAEQKDPATEDLFIEALRQAELDLWFLESHLHS